MQEEDDEELPLSDNDVYTIDSDGELYVIDAEQELPGLTVGCGASTAQRTQSPRPQWLIARTGVTITRTVRFHISSLYLIIVLP